MVGLPLPRHFDPRRVGDVWRVPYAERAREAPAWADRHGLRPAGEDAVRVALVIVDVQNTFCIPGFELFVAGRSGTGAVDDNRRLCEFVYRNLGAITQIFPSLDTHDAMQVFHPIWLVDERGRHPDPYTLISAADVDAGRWRVNETAVEAVGIDAGYAARHLAHYARRLAEGGKYDLTIWPYHAMLGGIGHALVSAVEEAVFFHGVARHSRPEFQVKGDHPLTEHYSILGPEVTEGPDGDSLGVPPSDLPGKLATFDAVVVAGQAKSHCLAWTIDDLLDARVQHGGGPGAERTYLLEDCTSPVVVPGVIDYTDQADAAFDRYVDAGMHVVRSTDPLESWPGLARVLGQGPATT
jgi:nicotinamidase-related amidase